MFEVVDETFSRPLVRFNRGNIGGFSSEEISKSGRFASLGVAGGDDESVDGGKEGGCFFRLRELYVRWTFEDINFDARAVDAHFGGKRRRDAFLWFCLHCASYLSQCHGPLTTSQSRIDLDFLHEHPIIHCVKECLAVCDS